MNVKHRRLLALGLAVAFVAAVGGVQYALALTVDETGVGITAKTAGVSNGRSVSQIAGQVINAVLSFVGTILLVLVIYAGFLWMTAQGVEERVKKAKGILANAVIGMIIIFCAYSISSYVFENVLTATMGGGSGSSASDEAADACRTKCATDPAIPAANRSDCSSLCGAASLLAPDLTECFNNATTEEELLACKSKVPAGLIK